MSEFKVGDIVTSVKGHWSPDSVGYKGIVREVKQDIIIVEMLEAMPDYVDVGYTWYLEPYYWELAKSFKCKSLL